MLAAWEEGREPLEKDAPTQAIWAGRAFGSPPPTYSIARQGSRPRGIFKVRGRSPSISLCEYTPIHDHVMSCHVTSGCAWGWEGSGLWFAIEASHNKRAG